MGRHSSWVREPDFWQASNFVVEPDESYKVENYATFEEARLRITEWGGIVTWSVPLITLKDILADTEGVSEIKEFFGEEI